MRILQIGKYHAPVRAGIENVVHSLSRALATALSRLLEDDGLRTRLRDGAPARAEREFSLERVVRDTVALCEEVTRMRGAAGRGPGAA